MIQGIFYARFFPRQGTKIVAQSPPGCIMPEPGVDRPPLFDFSLLQEYIVPRKSFYGRLLTVTTPDAKYAVLGLPVAIVSPHYERNEYIFNFGLVVEQPTREDDAEGGGGGGVGGGDRVPYELVVRRIANMFAEMEKQNGYLSQEDRRHRLLWLEEQAEGEGGNGRLHGRHDGGRAFERSKRWDGQWDGFEHTRRPIESLLEIIKEDLNNYGECMIPVDEANTINMKLFPYHPTPPEVKGWHVPVAKMKFADMVDPTWDLTLQKVVAHIDGVSDVRRIAWQADVALPLAALALRHLLYYDAILLLDMFFFGACYALRPAGVRDFVANVGGIIDECANYVCIGVPDPDDDADEAHEDVVVRGALGTSGVRRAGSSAAPAAHYARGSRGVAAGRAGPGPRPRRVSHYMLIKLMTTFCVNKTVMEWLKDHRDNGFDVLRYVDVRRLVQFGLIKGCLYRVHKYVVSQQYLAALASGQARPLAGGDPLQRYMDGRHCFDQIITEQNLTDPEIMERLKSLPAPAEDLIVIYK